MFEIIGESPSYTLVVPARCDLGRKTYRIINNEMYYHHGILTMGGKSTKMGLPSHSNPHNSISAGSVKSQLAFQDDLPEGEPRQIFERILEMNEQIRSGLEYVFTDENREILERESFDYWWHVLKLPVTDVFNESASRKEEDGLKSCIQVCQLPDSTQLQIMEPSYYRLHSQTRGTIKRALLLTGRNQAESTN